MGQRYNYISAETGKYLFPEPVYSATPFYSGYASIQKKPGEHTVISSQGSEIFRTNSVDEIISFYSGKFLVKKLDSYKFLDETGAQWGGCGLLSYAEAFSCGFAVAKDESGYFYLGADGNRYRNNTWLSINSFRDDRRAMIAQKSGKYLLNTELKIVSGALPFSSVHHDGGFIAFCDGGMFGLLSSQDLREVEAPKHGGIGIPKDEMLFYRNAISGAGEDDAGEFWGLKKIGGPIVATPQYIEYIDFNEKIGAVKTTENVWYLIDAGGVKLAGPYDRVTEFREGRCLAFRGERVIGLSRDFIEFIIPDSSFGKITYAFPFSCGYSMVRIDDEI